MSTEFALDDFIIIKTMPDRQEPMLWSWMGDVGEKRCSWDKGQNLPPEDVKLAASINALKNAHDGWCNSQSTREIRNIGSGND